MDDYTLRQASQLHLFLIHVITHHNPNFSLNQQLLEALADRLAALRPEAEPHTTVFNNPRRFYNRCHQYTLTYELICSLCYYTAYPRLLFPLEASPTEDLE